MEELKNLGQRLKQARIQRNDLQADFAFRIGVSTPTLCKMEKGDPKVGIGLWVKALEVLGRESEIDKLIAPKESLAARYELQQKYGNRQRVSRKR